MVSEGRGKPKVVVNIKISKDGGLCKRIETECTPLWKLNSQRIYYNQRS
ncbi:hypothetical protein E2C01_032056 [Portunus trituberculatus]|uniref:Uncharacterized protein n=1 Tax=Portunus trituberculatus TaxID=210409 RepID=A0A5B7EZB0_PORTR|nr:hypothetical protein [Portunus trituberculatus]